MRLLKESPPNMRWMGRIEDLWRSMLDEVLRRGFHGTASIEVQVIDGTIHAITRRVERVEK
jgi:hypothetical protein